MPERKTTRLRLRLLKELSIVDQPANPQATAVLMKRADGPPQSREADVPNDDLTKVQEALAKAQADLAEATKRLAALEADNKVLEGTVNDLTKKATDAEKALAAEIAKHRDPEEVLLEKMDPTARKAFEDMRAQSKAANELLVKMQTERDLAEVAKQIAADYPKLPRKADELAPVLMAASKALTPVQMDLLRETLKAASEAFASVEKAQGMSGGGAMLGTSAEAEIEKAAREIALRDSITFEQAYAKVLTARPELYAKFDAERRSRQ